MEVDHQPYQDQRSRVKHLDHVDELDVANESQTVVPQGSQKELYSTLSVQFSSDFNLCKCFQEEFVATCFRSENND